MKKIYIIALAALAASLFAVSCNKEQNAPDEPQVVETEQVTITATIPADLSKVAMDYSGDALELTWSVGDKIIVADHSNPSGNKQEFTLSSGEGTKSATFTGTAVSASSYDISLTSNWPANILAQSQPSDGSTAGLGYMVTLTNVNTYEDVSFSSSWATSKGGTFAQSGALHVQISLPSDVAETVNLVTMSADKNIFGSTGTMTVTLASQEDNGDPDLLDVYATIPPTGVSIPSGTGLLFKFGSTNPSHSVYTRYYKTSSVLNLAAGQLSKIYLTGTDIDKSAGKGDDGSEAHPFFIADKYQMIYLMNLYKAAEDAASTVKYWVKLVDDIDLSGVTWIPFNRAGNYNRAIDFDGNGHTISHLSVDGATYAYPSFAGVVFGDIRNVTFENSEIVGGGNNAGVVGGYIGTGSNVGNCSGVTVKNATVSGTGKNVGGFAGVVGAGGTISNCHVIGTNSISQTSTSTGRSAGGFIGNLNAAATITGCTAKANVSNTSSYYTAGFIGQVGSAVAATVSSCAFLGGTISAGRSNANSPVAGFVGRVAGNTGTGTSFTNCYVDGANISASVCGRTAGFVGDFGGSTSTTTITSCHVVNSTISGGINSAGFMGTYGKASKCYVDNTTITANAENTAGFIGYPQGSTITNCYVSSTVVVTGGTNNYVGGFIGLCKDNVTVTNCYEAATVTGSGSGVGAFIGKVDSVPTSITKCIAWDGSLSFYGALEDGVDDSVITGNYTGTTGTISGQATTLGWDDTIWNLSGSVPTLK